jgi:hypothetical protein
MLTSLVPNRDNIADLFCAVEQGVLFHEVVVLCDGLLPERVQVVVATEK